MCVSKHQSIGAEVVTHYLGSNMPTLEDHDDDDSDDELLEMHNYHVDFLPSPTHHSMPPPHFKSKSSNISSKKNSPWFMAFLRFRKKDTNC